MWWSLSHSWESITYEDNQAIDQLLSVTRRWFVLHKGTRAHVGKTKVTKTEWNKVSVNAWRCHNSNNFRIGICFYEIYIWNNNYVRVEALIFDWHMDALEK